MATLTDKTVATTYDQLWFRGATEPSSGSGAIQVLTTENDGTDDLATALYLGLARVGIANSSPSVALDVTGATTISGALTVGGNIDFNSGTIDLSTQTVDVTLTGSIDALNFDSNTLSIDASNKSIGIGTAAPASNLHIYGSGSQQLLIGSSNELGATIVLDGDSNGDGQGSDYCYIAHDTAGILNIVQDNPADGAHNQIRFGTNGIEDLIAIDTNGYLGINELSPDEMLHLTSTTANKPIIKLENVSDDATGAGIEFYKTAGSGGSGQEPDDVLGSIDFYGRTGATIPKLYNSIIGAIQDDDAGSGDGRLDFTQLVGDSLSSVLVMRIEKGRVGINGKGVSTVMSPQSLVHVEGPTSGTAIVDIGLYNSNIATSHTLGALRFTGVENSDYTYYHVGAQILAVTSEAWTNSTSGGELYFYTCAGGGSTAIGDPKMVLTATGRLGIGDSDPACALEVNGAIAGGVIAITASADNTDVSGAMVVKVNTNSPGTVDIGAFVGGVSGQVLFVYKETVANDLILRHNHETAYQNIALLSGSDETVAGVGGWTLICDGASWHAVSQPTGAASSA